MLRLIVRPLLLVLGLLITVVGLVNRPLRGRLVSRLLPLYRFLSAQRGLSNLAYWVDYFELELLYNQRAAWSQMQPIIAKAPSAKYRARAAQYAVNLYFPDGRFDECRAALRYGCRVTEDWVQEHREEARADMQLVRESRHYAAARLKGETPQSRWSSDHQAARAAIRLSETVADQYFNLHVALSFLEWSEAQGDVQMRQVVDLMPKKGMKRKLIASEDIDFEQHLAERLGIDEATLNRIYAEAGSI